MKLASRIHFSILQPTCFLTQIYISETFFYTLGEINHHGIAKEFHAFCIVTPIWFFVCTSGFKIFIKMASSDKLSVNVLHNHLCSFIFIRVGKLEFLYQIFRGAKTSVVYSNSKLLAGNYHQYIFVYKFYESN